MIKELLLLSALAAVATGQSVPPAGHDAKVLSGPSQNDGKSNVRISPVDLKPTDPIPGVTASPAMVVPFQCTDDGAVFLNFIAPKDGTETLYSLLDRVSQKFDGNSITDIHGLELISSFPTRTMVAFLVQGTKTSADAATTESQRETKHYFVAEFDRAGHYKKAIQLATEFPLFRLAVLDSGEFLVTGYDSATDSERLLLLDDLGQLVRPIDQPLSDAERSARRSASSTMRMYAGAQSSGLTNFVGYKDKVLVWRSGTNDPVLEVNGDGAKREVSIAVPKGSVLQDVVPSDDQWIIHVSADVASSAGPRELSGYQYYEVSPLDGSLERQLSTASSPINSIACKSRGKYIAFATDKDNHLIEFVGYDR
jgi:hypothetical protein